MQYDSVHAAAATEMLWRHVWWHAKRYGTPSASTAEQAWTGQFAKVPRHSTGTPFEKMTWFQGTCRLEMFKMFCALVVTVKTCVLRVATKKVVNFLHPWICSPPCKKIMRAPMTAADGTASETSPVRLCCWTCAINAFLSLTCSWVETLTGCCVNVIILIIHAYIHTYCSKMAREIKAIKTGMEQCNSSLQSCVAARDAGNCFLQRVRIARNADRCTS